MMLTLVGDLETFASERGSVQQRREDALYGSALYALRHYGERGWYLALVERATRLMREQYHEDTGHWTSKTMRREQDEFRARSRSALSKTKKPTPEGIKAQARAIAASLATGAINAALEAAGVDDERTALDKVWISMHDERVRVSHRDADRQAVPIGEKFTVGGVKMSRPGDSTAPIEEWINCRCVMAIVERSEPGPVAASGSHGVIAAAEDQRSRSVGIFAIPAEHDAAHRASSEDVAHMTVIWMGTDEQREEAGVTLALPSIKDDVRAAAASLGVTIANITERGTLGDDEADVLFLDADDVRPIREALLEHETILNAMKAVEQYPEWTPHVTLGYPDSPGVVQFEERTVTFDRLALWVGDSHYEYPLGGDMADDQDTDAPEAPNPEDRLDYADEAVPFWGVLAPEEIESGDRRKFGTLRSRPLPLPLAYQRVNAEGHGGSVKVANIERAWRRGDGMVYATGHFLTTVPEVDEVVGVMAESGGRTGVSVDADDGEMQMFMRDGRNLDDIAEDEEFDVNDVVTYFPTARICGATLCNIPAFHQAFIALGEPPEEFLDGEDLAVESIAEMKATAPEAEAEAVAASAFKDLAPGRTEDGPGWLTHPVDTDRLRDYWVRGPGAAKIGWGAPGDFNRCRLNLAKYVKPQYLSGYCANRHFDALGFWPGQHHSLNALAAAVEAAREVGHEPEGEMAPAISLVAAAGRTKRPPREWFSNPNLVGPSPITITEDGRVFGHLAAWGTCHIGITGQCVTPPPSPSDYAYFRTGSIVTEDGSTLPVGQITMDTGHANGRKNAVATLAHYDNTGTASADVVAGEDEYGIWVAGAVRGSLAPEKIEAMRAGCLSGDWRTIGGNLELVAALVVNVPGFPIPHTSIAASGGEQVSLVAAGIVTAQQVLSGEVDIRDVVQDAVSTYFATEDARKRMKVVQQTLDQRRMALAAERIEKVRARTGKSD